MVERWVYSGYTSDPLSWKHYVLWKVGDRSTSDAAPYQQNGFLALACQWLWTVKLVSSNWRSSTINNVSLGFRSSGHYWVVSDVLGQRVGLISKGRNHNCTSANV